MKLKTGVKINSLQPQIVFASVVIQSIFNDVRMPEFVVTSGCDSQHGPKSKHWTGDAIDIRTREFSTLELRRETFLEIQKALGSDFDCADEADHFHIEYDPTGRP